MKGQVSPKQKTCLQIASFIASVSEHPTELQGKVFLEISQNSQESTCARVSFLIKLQARLRCNKVTRDSGTGVFLSIL